MCGKFSLPARRFAVAITTFGTSQGRANVKRYKEWDVVLHFYLPCSTSPRNMDDRTWQQEARKRGMQSPNTTLRVPSLRTGRFAALDVGLIFSEMLRYLKKTPRLNEILTTLSCRYVYVDGFVKHELKFKPSH